MKNPVVRVKVLRKPPPPTAAALDAQLVLRPLKPVLAPGMEAGRGLYTLLAALALALLLVEVGKTLGAAQVA